MDDLCYNKRNQSVYRADPEVIFLPSTPRPIRLLAPDEGQTVSLILPLNKTFFETGGNKKIGDFFDYHTYAKQNGDLSFGAPVVLRWDDPASARVLLADSPTLTNARAYDAAGGSAEIYNLIPGRTYFWQVQTETGASNVRSFCTETALPRWIKADGMSNIRDLGGWKTADGQVIRFGKIYRGCEMEFHYQIEPTGRKVLADELGIRTDLDLRAEAVGKIEASALGMGVDFRLLPLLPDDRVFDSVESCRQVFGVLADESVYPVYLHCWGGADRTGTVAFLLGALLGVSYEDLCLDYELTSLSTCGDRSSNSERFQALWKRLQAYGETGDDANTLSEKFLRKIGVTDSEIKSIRRLLLARPGEEK